MNISMRFGFAGWLRQAWDMLVTGRYEKHLISELQRVIADRDEWKEKCSKLELAIFPLASKEGAIYAHLAKPPEPMIEVMSGAKGFRSWAQVQADHLKSLEAEEQSDGTNGVRTETAGREAKTEASSRPGAAKGR